MNKQTVIFIILGVSILVGLGYFLLKPAPNQQQVSNQTPVANNQTEEKTQEPPSNLVEAEFIYTSSNYEPKSVEVKQGQKVVLKITADIADEAHLHGYDLSKALVPGQSVTIEFTADKTGRFDLELENLGKSLGVVAVYPN